MRRSMRAPRRLPESRDNGRELVWWRLLGLCDKDYGPQAGSLLQCACHIFKELFAVLLTVKVYPCVFVRDVTLEGWMLSFDQVS